MDDEDVLSECLLCGCGLRAGRRGVFDLCEKADSRHLQETGRGENVTITRPLMLHTQGGGS